MCLWARIGIFYRGIYITKLVYYFWSFWPKFDGIVLSNSGHFQQEYIRGISAWNFNLEDLKSQAALVSSFFFWTYAYIIIQKFHYICGQDFPLTFLPCLALCYLQIQDFDGIPNAEDPDVSMKQKDRNNNVEPTAERLSHERANHSTTAPCHQVIVVFFSPYSQVFPENYWLQVLPYVSHSFFIVSGWF